MRYAIIDLDTHKVVVYTYDLKVAVEEIRRLEKTKQAPHFTIAKLMG